MESKLWNALIAALPHPHFLQTYEWGQVKAAYGWTPIYLVWSGKSYRSYRLEQVGLLSSIDLSDVQAACLVLKRSVSVGGLSARLSILYAPKGPLLDWTDQPLRTRVRNDLQSFAKHEGAIFIKIDPDVVIGTGIPGSAEDDVDRSGQSILSELQQQGWRYSSDQIQFKNTVRIDLRPAEEDLLTAMKQKTRYNVRLASKKGVTLRIGTQDDLNMLYKMYAETSVRDGFVIRDQDYYSTVWQTFMRKSQSSFSNPQTPITNHQLPFAEPLIAEVNREPVAAIFIFYFAGRAYYVYGMSRDVHREKMPSYFLQWEAIKRARSKGCLVYDLWGAPDVFDESDSMWGVYRFKEGLGGQVVRTLGAWDFAPNPLWYTLYSETIPRLLDLMRSRGKAKTKQSLGGS